MMTKETAQILQELAKRLPFYVHEPNVIERLIKLKKAYDEAQAVLEEKNLHRTGEVDYRD